MWPGGPRRSTHTVWFYLWLPKLQVATRRGRGDVTHRARENNSRSIPTTVRGTDEMRDTGFLASRSHGPDDESYRGTDSVRYYTTVQDECSVMIGEICSELLVRLPRCTRRERNREAVAVRRRLTSLCSLGGFNFNAMVGNRSITCIESNSIAFRIAFLMNFKCKLGQ